MANLTDNVLTNNITTPSQTIVFHTKDTYVENDITVNNIVKDGSITSTQGNASAAYNQNSSLTLNSGGSIYINEGWIPNTQISLDSLLPDKENMIIDDAIRAGYHGWNDKGVEIVGSMPDVNPAFQGGGLTFSDGTTSVSGNEVVLAPSGTITDTPTQTKYGITKTLTEDLNNYLSISTNLRTPTPKVSIKDISATRATVEYSQNYKGYLEKNQGVTALASITEKTSVDVDVNITSNNTFGTYYIPYANKPEVKGGVATLQPSVSFTNPTVTISGTISTNASTYGITETRPTTGSENTNYIKLSKAATDNTESTITPNVTGTVSAVTVSQNAGLTSKLTNEVKIAEQNISQNGNQKNTSTKITNNTKDYYIPIVTGTPTANSTVNAAVVSNSIASNTQIELTTTTPTNTADYIELTLTSNTRPGSVATTPQITIENAGLIKNGTIKGTETTESVTVNVSNPKYYIRKYDGSYTIS